MRIALCVKQVLDVTGPFSLIEETETLENAGLVPIVNPADLAALALVRSALPMDVAEVTAITVGPRHHEHALRNCIASGADRAIRVWDAALEGTRVGGDVIAHVLAAAVSTLKFDLVVCGSKGLCGGSGYVGPALAEYLGFAQVCSVSSLDFILGRTALTLQRRLDHGDREVVVCKLPAVITVDEGSAEVPYASLPSVLAAQRIGVKVLDLAAVGLKPADARPSTGGRFLNYVQPRPRTKKVPALDTSLSPMQMMQQISGGGGPKKSGGPVEGDPKKVAAEIVRFLASNSLLPKESDGPLH